MKYYEMHESVYQKLSDQGLRSWDKATTTEQILDSSMNQSLLEHFPSMQALSTLDLGTGAGNCALFCAQHGADASGVDLSQAAINMAKANGKALNLEAQFLVADILELCLPKKFDLITDSSLLHCLIGDDRKRFYETVKRHLRPNGHLFIHTMVESDDMSQLVDPRYFVFDYPILWSLGFKEITTGRKEFNNQSYFPHRTVLTLKEQLAEISEMGFKISSHKLNEQLKSPSTLTLLASKP